MRVLIVALLLSPTSAAATAFYGGNMIHDLCREGRGRHLGYVAGVMDTLVTMHELDMAPEVFCSSNDVTLGQAGDVVCRYLERHPEKRHLSASSLVGSSLREAWPCSR